MVRECNGRCSACCRRQGKVQRLPEWRNFAAARGRSFADPCTRDSGNSEGDTECREEDGFYCRGWEDVFGGALYEQRPEPTDHNESRQWGSKEQQCAAQIGVLS